MCDDEARIDVAGLDPLASFDDEPFVHGGGERRLEIRHLALKAPAN